MLAHRLLDDDHLRVQLRDRANGFVDAVDVTADGEGGSQPSVSVAAGGNFVVAFLDATQGVLAQLFDEQQAPGPLATAASPVRTLPFVAAGPDGFVTAWTDPNGDGPGDAGVRARLFDAQGEGL